MPSDRQGLTDIAIWDLVNREQLRQQQTIRLIPSENYASKPVREACGSWLTNKYSEGYPGKRYYQGQGIIDQLETLVIDRAKQLFGAEHANVQSYSGSTAVLQAYVAMCDQPGDTIMGPKLDHGGHLTHGHKVSVTSQFYKAVQYGVSQDTENFDFDEIEKLAVEHKPKVIVCGGTAFPRVIDFEKFAAVAKKVGAKLLADMSHIAGLVAAGVHPSPFPHADMAVCTTHKTLRGPRGALILCKEELAKAADRAVFPASQGGPHQNTIAALGIALFEAQTGTFKNYAAQIIKNSRAMGEALAAGGLRLVTGGSDNHLLLVDLTALNVNGKDAAIALEKAGIVCNMNMVPFDKGTPMKPSGIRLGTPCITTRGMAEPEMAKVAQLILQVLKAPADEAIARQVRQSVYDLCEAFPVPEYFV